VIIANPESIQETEKREPGARVFRIVRLYNRID